MKLESKVAVVTGASRGIGRVEDIADAVALLASPESAWVTGHYIEASGGLGLLIPCLGTN